MVPPFLKPPWRRRRIAALAAGALVLAGPTSAQQRRPVEFAPALGFYSPNGDLPLGVVPAICVVNPFLPDSPDNCLPFYKKAKPAAAFGGRVTAWLNRRAALEGSLWYSPSGVKGFVVTPFDGSSDIVFADLRLAVDLAPHATTSFILLSGPAIVRRESFTRIGGGIGAALDIRRAGSFALRPEIDVHRYSIQGHYQQDVIASVSARFLGPGGAR
jgi:hypothetical protein